MVWCEEMKSLHKNYTFDLAKLHNEKRALKNKCVQIENERKHLT